MGASGKNLAGHGARHKSLSPPAQSKDGGHGLPPHPLTVRSGQRYVPREGKRKRPFQIGRIDRAAGKATGRRLDGEQERVTVSIGRLLAVRDDGQGRHFQMQGFHSRRYKTYAVVAGIRDDGQAELVLPEWHPARPVRYPARLLPTAAGVPGSWLRCSADLSQGRPARLDVADLEPCPDPGPAVCHRPSYTTPAAAQAVARPAAGKGCGDIVLELPAGLDRYVRVGGLLEIAVAERAHGVRAGDRVYLAERGHIARYLELAGRQMLPNGDRLRCDPEPVALPQPIPVKGRCEQHHWRWRWWDRELEQHATAEQLAAIADAHDPVAHDPDYVWTHFHARST